MEIIGHKKQLNFFKKTFQSGKLSHAYLLVGPDELGKKTLAFEIASIILNSNQPINIHPDFVLIEPTSKDIQIFEIRELIRKISFKPSLAQKKIAIIDNAHLMNQEAQACFLKTLEEPRGDCLLILITSQPGFLLPTIISRVPMIKFNFVNQQEIKKYLLDKNILNNQAEEITRISLGKPGRAINLAFNDRELDNFNQKIKELDELLCSSLFFRFQYVKKITENLKEIKEIKEILDVWLYFFREEFLKKPNEKIIKTINLIEATRYLILTTNVNLKLALERIILAI